MTTSNNQKNDLFAEIAASGMDFKGKNLIEPQPPILEEKYLDTSFLNNEAIFVPNEKITSPEELKQELERQKTIYAPFMCNYALEIHNFRFQKNLEEFDWRIGTEADDRIFFSVLLGVGLWEKVNIPHYGEPLGLATTFYRTQFIVTEQMLNVGSTFICFKAVDYKAHVFINGSYLGSHEGFFAPFEFDFTKCAVVGLNTLLVKVENDFICGGNSSPAFENKHFTGDKIYAATGVGYDDSERGWHHCPPGMGIYQEIFIESRPALYIGDIYIRPLEDLENAEAWVEVYNCDVYEKEVKLSLSLYGKNFNEVVFENLVYLPMTGIEVGLGDSFTEANLKAAGKLNSAIPLKMQKGRNRLIIPFKVPSARKWEINSPWLYQINLELIHEAKVSDTSSQHFGMRFFKMDTTSTPKGSLTLNGNQIRLRGANTMGHEQQCVFKKDYDQLRDDILLAKICNMNFLRLTQRPVQPEVYDYCDMLGLMTQTDLPLFGVLSRSQFCEAVRQAEEMERLIRCHPCNIMVTYINEPFPNACNKPQKNLTRPELVEFFKAADIAVKLNNPDRVIKHVDGDYDPPSETLPDNHCYPCWYNGHGIDIGRLNRGYWLPVKPDWYYGCGEFGSEGLDPIEVMQEHYPQSWLPHSQVEENSWLPSQIVGAQSGNFHYFFYETPETLEEWVKESHKHQAWATKVMTEAFRRDSHMTTFAIHLFIDAFPSGWMKSIMDVERTPKPSYFAYRDALEPLMVNIRSDRFKYTSNEEIKLEAWICNDLLETPPNSSLLLMLEMNGQILAASKQVADIPACSSKFQGYISFQAPTVMERTNIQVKLGLMCVDGQLINCTDMEIEIFPVVEKVRTIKAWLPGDKSGVASNLVTELGIAKTSSLHEDDIELIVLDDYASYIENETNILMLVKRGASLVMLELPEGVYEIAGSEVIIKTSGMLPMHFASRKTNHPLVKGFKCDDFRLWYDPEKGVISPLLESTFVAEDFTPILLSGNTDTQGKWGKAFAVADKSYGEGRICVCQLKLAGRSANNPVAKEFAIKLLG